MKSVSTKYSFKHGSLFAICAIEKTTRKAAYIFSHAHNSGASMAEMWDPRSTEQFRWTRDSECDHPGWMILHYFIKVLDSCLMEMLGSLMQFFVLQFRLFLCLRC